MSNALALGAVSAVVKSLLENDLIRRGLAAALGGTPTVTLLPPDAAQPGGNTAKPDRLNLFLYQTTPNAAWRNAGLPSRSGGGDRLTNPPLALDLHYLLTAYSQETFHAEILLGYGMQLLHETPVLTRDAIRTALSSLSAPGAPAAQRALAAADLAEQIEQIKITPEALSSEEMSRLWSGLQSPYRLTAAYQLSVVLIESHRATKSALPVRDRRLYVLPFHRPQIDAVSPQVLKVGESLTILGQNLKSDLVQVKFGGVAVTPGAIEDSKIQVLLPAGLSAGVNAVQVVHLLDLQTGSPDEPHRGSESNVAAFIVTPEITGLPVPPLTVARGNTLTLSVTPPVGADQQVALLLDSQAIAIPPRSGTTTSLNFPIPNDFPVGTFLLRLQVDGAESALEVDENPASPTFNLYMAPKVQVT
ncbi:MAG TPA: DUF4255 domain-containing protein [Coleofasciculaceae cyanobacterium]|jgi:hypothetical protein